MRPGNRRTLRASMPAPPSTPDPLAPPDVSGPARAAPGAPVAPPRQRPRRRRSQAVVAEVDPIVALVRQRLSRGAARRQRGRSRRTMRRWRHSTPSGSGQPVWTSKDGLTARATQAIDEIRKADDWGLKASAFDVPALPDASATAEALADAEIKLGLAVLKYARHARGGRLDPPSISRLFDQKPTIYDPKTLDAGHRGLRRRRRLSARPASQAPAVRAPAPGACWQRAASSPTIPRPR